VKLKGLFYDFALWRRRVESINFAWRIIKKSSWLGRGMAVPEIYCFTTFEPIKPATIVVVESLRLAGKPVRRTKHDCIIPSFNTPRLGFIKIYTNSYYVLWWSSHIATHAYLIVACLGWGGAFIIPPVWWWWWLFRFVHEFLSFPFPPQFS
jgi:hypothetical protein